MKSIRVDKHKTIVFMGSMNAFPMMYALELKRYGYDVLYFVDVPRTDTLSRPENHFPSVTYPYPDWIVEWTLPLQIMLLLSPKFFAWRLSSIIKKHTKKEIGCYALNGFFISLTPYLPKATFVSLSHGSDLDVWANVENIDVLRKGVFHSKLMKKIPVFIQSYVIRKFIKKQKKGFLYSDYLNYMPRGFNKAGDKIVTELQEIGVNCISRSHVSFAHLTGQNRGYRENRSTLRICSGVRFLYKEFPRGNSGYNKGNNKIIAGLAEYCKINPNIRIDFVEKGTDLDKAKILCKDMGLNSYITWHKEMPFYKLIELYQKVDICFDQVGDHWIGGVGVFALWLGKPLIADDSKYVNSGAWPDSNPICSASSVEDIYGWLCKLSDNEERKRVSIASRVFADECLDIKKFPNAVFQLE